MMNQSPQIIAIIYDFDKTLSPKSMQEYSFIPSLKMDANEFWEGVKQVTKQHNADEINIYMYEMLRQAKLKNLDITQAEFKNHGVNIELFPGVDNWFNRINYYVKNYVRNNMTRNVKIEHYIISSGNKEIIEGSRIAKFFTKIFASTFLYDTEGKAIWPAVVVNYTNKTQYLFRINKGCYEEWDNESVNKFIPKEERRIAFRNMIYIGDGLTDIPCMKLVKNSGGTSIAVYQNGNDYNKKIAISLKRDERVSYVCTADYKKNSCLETIILNAIQKIVTTID